MANTNGVVKARLPTRLPEKKATPRGVIVNQANRLYKVTYLLIAYDQISFLFLSLVLYVCVLY